MAGPRQTAAAIRRAIEALEARGKEVGGIMITPAGNSLIIAGKLDMGLMSSPVDEVETDAWDKAIGVVR